MVGGLAATSLGSLYVSQERGMTLGFIDKAVRKGAYEGPVGTMLLVGALAAIVALHFIQRQRYGRWGALASAVAVAGLAMVVAGNLLGELVPTMASAAIILLVVGVLAASVGIVGMGIVTITKRVLPRWCGIAVIAGSPPGVGILFTAVSPLVTGRILPGELGWALAGIPWMVVGLAVFLAAGRLTEQASRVR